MARILIDGYNLLAATDYVNREQLMNALAGYRRIRQHEIRIIFDGTHKGTGTGTQTTDRGVDLIYSPITVTADDLIEEMMRKKDSSSWIVVSSDRRIQSAATRARATYMTSEEFAGRLARAGVSLKDSPILEETTPPWLEGRTEEESRPPAKRKGRARHLPKQEKRRRKKLGRI